MLCLLLNSIRANFNSNTTINWCEWLYPLKLPNKRKFLFQGVVFMAPCLHLFERTTLGRIKKCLVISDIFLTFPFKKSQINQPQFSYCTASPYRIQFSKEMNFKSSAVLFSADVILVKSDWFNAVNIMNKSASLLFVFLCAICVCVCVLGPIWLQCIPSHRSRSGACLIEIHKIHFWDG